MPRFIAAHTLPMTEEQFFAAMQTFPEIPTGVTWKQTYCDFAGGKFFCEWEAPRKEAVEECFQMMKMPYDAVYPVRVFDVANKTIEPAL